jgi:hypothetical protein
MAVDLPEPFRPINACTRPGGEGVRELAEGDGAVIGLGDVAEFDRAAHGDLQ